MICVRAEADVKWMVHHDNSTRHESEFLSSKKKFLWFLGPLCASIYAKNWVLHMPSVFLKDFNGNFKGIKSLM